MLSWSNFQTGENVRIVQGTFSGMKGRIISVTEALQRELWISDSVRNEESYWVILTIFGRDVPLELEPQQMVSADEQ